MLLMIRVLEAEGIGVLVVCVQSPGCRWMANGS
jgi:hypothetical protein